MNVSEAEVCVILPAAGIGERMGLDVPKQFVYVSHRPLIYYTIIGFLRLSWIKRIIIVISPENNELMTETLNFIPLEKRQRVQVTCNGAESRHESIYAGLKFLETVGCRCDLVVVHDAVRPFVDEKLLDEVVYAALKYGASGVMCPLTSTVVAVNNHDELHYALDRNMFRASEMPQAFQFPLILEAYSKCSTHDLKFGTECLHVVQKYKNINAKLVVGSSVCWKVTYKKDLITARGMLRENEGVGIVCNTHGKENIAAICSVLKTCLMKSFKRVEGPSSIPIHDMTNLVIIHPMSSTMSVINEGCDIPLSSWQPMTLVNITFDGNKNINIQALQEKSKEIARKWKQQRLIYYVISKGIESSSDLLRETAEIVTSLLFESNASLSGMIFVI